MEKLSKTIVGYPLKNTSPAGIERELIDRIRKELGEFSDLALIQPILKIDSEDGTMSGNVTNGFGTIVLRVVNKDLHIPFIIYQKELLPFDTIRMGDEEVAYDMSKLRQLVNVLDKKQKESSDGEMSESIVDFKDVPSRNGFLGNIMDIRDDYYRQDATGGPSYSGDTFGIIDNNRMERFASVDVGNLFEEFHEKLADVQVFAPATVEKVAKEIEIRFKEEAEKAIKSDTSVDIPTKTSVEVERTITMLNADKLMSVAEVTSGNNVQFPVFDDSMLEYRLGRVYKKIKSAAIAPLNTQYKKIVIDSTGRYAFLKEREKFMVSRKNPPAFDMREVRAMSLSTEKIYTTEVNETEIYAPFEIQETFVRQLESNSEILNNRMHNADFYNFQNSDLIRDVIRAKQTLPIRITLDKQNIPDFVIIVLKQSDTPFTQIKFSELKEMIATKESSPEGIRAANYAIERMLYTAFSRADEEMTCFIVGDKPTIFMPLESRIQGFFSKANYLEEAMSQFEKSAAYQKHNKARLYVEQRTNPQTYRLEWEYSAPQGEGEFKIETRSQDGLTPAQAKKMLSELGFDERKKESFFQIAKQNGRMAEFSLPSGEVAAKVSPQDKGKNKAEEFVKGLVNTSLNASNFIPIMQDTISSGLTDIISPAAGAAAMSPKGEAIRQMVSGLFGKEAEESMAVAIEMEKIAEHFRGAEWFRAAQLVNMKHHLDKLAFETTGNFVKEAENVWCLLPQLDGEIAKTAKQLILFNREQMMKTSSNIVPGGLVKEAITQLDGLANYSHAAKEMMERLAFFRSSRVNKEILTQLDDNYKNLKNAYNKAREQMTHSDVKLRAAKQTNLEQTNPEAFQKLQNEVMQKTETMHQTLEDLVRNRQTQGEFAGKVEQGNRLNALSVFIPTAFAAGIGANAIKDE